MSRFLDRFPKIPYDINRGDHTEYDKITDLTFRFSFFKDILSNVGAYYHYTIQEGDTPEILADKVYGNPEAYWIILYANNIYDPQFDWPLDKTPFQKYLVGKYGSIENAKNTMHHYEKVIVRRVNQSNEVFFTDRQVVNYTKYTNNDLTVPYDYYTNLAETQSVRTFNIAGKTVEEITNRLAVSCYDYEMEMNENRREINIIKSDYYGQIMEEFKKMTGSTESFIRRLK